MAQATEFGDRDTELVVLTAALALGARAEQLGGRRGNTDVKKDQIKLSEVKELQRVRRETHQMGLIQIRFCRRKGK